MKKTLPLLFSKLSIKVLKNCASRFYLFFTLSSVLLFSCETQEKLTHIGQKSYESQQISLNQFIKETGDNNFDKIISIKYNSNNILGKSTSSNYDLTDFDIDTNGINSMLIFNKNTYTFRVKPKNYIGTNLFNLIYYKKNNTWEKTIIEMKPNADNLYKLQNGLTTKFEGEIKQIFNSETQLIKSKFAKSSVNAMSSSQTNCSTYTVVEERCIGCIGECDKCNQCVKYHRFYLCDSGGGDSFGGFNSGVNLDQGASEGDYSFPDANDPDTTFFEPNINNPYGDFDEIYASKFNEFKNSLRISNERLFEYLNQNPTVKNQIFNFLTNNNFSSDSDVFAVEILNQIKQNPSLNLNIEASFKSPMNIDFGTISNNTPEGAKFNEVYTALTQSPEFKKLFESIFKDSKRFNVKFEIGSVQNGANGNTNTDLNNPTLNTITISPDFLKNSNKMRIAKTIIHECIHAYLNVKLCDSGQGLPITTLNDLDFFNVVNQQYNGFKGNQDQHNFIYNYMLPTMKTVLAEVKDLLVTQVNNSTMINDTYVYIPFDYSPSTHFIWSEFYHNLALSGLQNCAFFQNEIGTIKIINGVPIVTNTVDQTLMQSYNQYNKMGDLYINP